MSEFWNARTVRSRQVRRCDECRTDIPAGEAHLYIASVEEGDFHTFRLCDRCNALRTAIWLACDLDQDQGPCLGEARQWVIEEIGHADPDAWLAEWQAGQRAAVEARSEAARLIDRQTAATIGWTGEIPGHGGPA